MYCGAGAQRSCGGQGGGGGSGERWSSTRTRGPEEDEFGGAFDEEDSGDEEEGADTDEMALVGANVVAVEAAASAESRADGPARAWPLWQQKRDEGFLRSWR